MLGQREKSAYSFAPSRGNTRYVIPPSEYGCVIFGLRDSEAQTGVCGFVEIRAGGIDKEKERRYMYILTYLFTVGVEATPGERAG